MIQMTNDQYEVYRQLAEAVYDLYEEIRTERELDPAYIKQNLGGIVRRHREARAKADAEATGPSGYEREKGASCSG